MPIPKKLQDTRTKSIISMKPYNFSYDLMYFSSYNKSQLQNKTATSQKNINSASTSGWPLSILSHRDTPQKERLETYS